MTYTIWIIPPLPIKETLQTTINKLAEKYNTPTFEPHLTVVGDIKIELPELEEKLTNIAKTTQPLELSLGLVSFSTTYFQSVFVRINSTASLMQLNLDVKTALSLENSMYMPHISLVYGQDSMKMREKIAATIELPAASFVATSLTITTSSEDPKSWKTVAKIQLKG